MPNPEPEDAYYVREWLWKRQEPFIAGYHDGSRHRTPTQSEYLERPVTEPFKQHYLEGWKAGFAAEGHQDYFED